MAHPALWTKAAAGAVRLVSASSRLAGLGGGSTVGGRVGLALEPGLLAALGAGRTSALVSGTNGKTTTTRLLAEALSTLGAVATSAAGANLPAGIVAALADAPRASHAVLEVDEAYLAEVERALRPAVIVLLNLSRDQLDRVSEVRMVARRWRDLLATYDGTVVANADDPLVTWAAAASARARFVGAGGQWRDDAHHCPNCGTRLSWSAERWACTCGFARPECAAELDGDELCFRDERLALKLALPGRFNRANAALALVAACELGVAPRAALEAMAGVSEVAGRFARAEIGGVPARLLLAKNPAGWTELLELVHADDGPVVIGINARIADGRDPSWLWDVPFELLAGRLVVATGERRLDLAVRLRHAGVGHRVADDPVAAIASLGEAATYIGNYTAFQDLRRALAKAGGRAGKRPLVPPSPEPGPWVCAPPSPGTPPRRIGHESMLRIVVVHPDLLATYGDGGNGLVLANRARWRGIPVELLAARSDEALPAQVDCYLLGGGEDGPQAHAAAVLRDSPLRSAVAAGASVLAICAGYQILGESFPDADGRPLAGVGLLEVTTRPGGAPRAVGELALEAAEGALGQLTGFENHAGRTERGAGVEPLGIVRSGIGNGDGTDGARSGRLVGTYLHGPILARNPALADWLLERCTGKVLTPLPDEEEAALRAERFAALRSAGSR
ncbi:MAG: MurT ligase domain-containing protein [Actinomycetota bacterium]|nr:MurT ligase domain-containing protein [Actinomycetota bacterium]